MEGNHRGGVWPAQGERITGVCGAGCPVQTGMNPTCHRAVHAWTPCVPVLVETQGGGKAVTVRVNIPSTHLVDQGRHLDTYTGCLVGVGSAPSPADPRAFVMPSQGASAKPSHGLLQQLHLLSRTSPEFLDKLSSILYGEEYKRSVPNLRGDDLVWLVDYLDEVRCHVSLLRSPLKLPQALDILDPASPAFRKSLRELRHICGARAILPRSHALLSSLKITSRQPVASGGSGDVYEGTLNGSKVCVKRVRVYAKDGPMKVPKVWHPVAFSVCCC